jgi:hypothetical protein
VRAGTVEFATKKGKAASADAALLILAASIVAVSYSGPKT